MEIKVLGTGCANCKNTQKLIEAVAQEKHIPVTVIKVEAIEEIMAFGVATTPAVVVNGVVVHSGGVPSRDKVLSMLGCDEKTAACCSGGNCASTTPEDTKPASTTACCSSTSESKPASANTAPSSCTTGTCGSDVGAKNGMGVDALINLMSGSMVLLGLLLAHLSGTVDMTSASWLWLPAFVGINLIQFAFTGFCPAKRIFEKMGVKKSCC
jgi:small redox-active disulfide protein 2